MAKLYRLVCACTRDDLVDLVEIRVLRTSETCNEKEVGVQVVVVELANGLASRRSFADKDDIGRSRLDQKLKKSQKRVQSSCRYGMIP